jgi:hypothetical protein
MNADVQCRHDAHTADEVASMLRLGLVAEQPLSVGD